MEIKNTQREIVRIWTWITLFFLAVGAYPIIKQNDFDEISMLLLSLSVFMVIIGLVIVLVYRVRAKRLDELISGTDLLAHWNFTAQEWQAYVAYDYGKRRATMLITFYVIGGMLMTVGIIGVLVTVDYLFLIVCTGITAFVGLLMYTVLAWNKARLTGKPGFVLLSTKSVLLNGVFHNWTSLRARVEKVIHTTEVSPSVITLEYSMPAKNGRTYTEIRIPVPLSQTKQASEIAEKIRAANR